jgi:hypothetical protein
MSGKPPSKSAHLQELIHRREKVLAVLHPPTAAHARIMEKAGCEALFVGTGGVVGAYTGLADVGTATMTDCVPRHDHPGLGHRNEAGGIVIRLHTQLSLFQRSLCRMLDAVQ